LVPRQDEAIDVAAVVVIREIVSAGPEVIAGRMVSRQPDDDLLQAVGVGLEPKRQQQLPQRAALARDESDGDVFAPWLAQPDDRPPTRPGPEHPDSRQA